MIGHHFPKFLQEYTATKNHLKGNVLDNEKFESSRRNCLWNLVLR